MKLLKSTVLVSSNTMLSRVTGLVRDVVLARAFGASAAFDAFLVAFRIPNFLRRLFAEGSFSLAFVPVFAEYRERGDEEALRALIDRVAGTLAGVLAVVTVIGVVAAPLIIMAFAPGFMADQAKFDLSVAMLRVTFPYIMFISLAALAQGILNSFGRFGVPAFTPVLLNLSLISAAIWLAPRMEQPVTALAWGVFIAGLAQLAIQLPFLKRLKLLPRPRWGWRDSGVRKILKLMAPTIFGSSVAQINLLFDTLVASFLITGSVTWLYWSDRLVELPLGVFGIALATVILPRLSADHAAAAPERFHHTLDWGLRWVTLIMVPATVGLITLGGPTLATLFRYGAVTGNDIHMASFSLAAYALGLPAYALVKVLAPAFFARQDPKTPVKIGLAAMALNMLLNVIFVFVILRAFGVAAHAGLALASAIAAWLNASLLFVTLRRRGSYHPGAGWPGLLFRVAVASAAMGAVGVMLGGSLESWLEMGLVDRVLRLAMVIGACVAVYGGGLLLTGFRPRHMAESHHD